MRQGKAKIVTHKTISVSAIIFFISTYLYVVYASFSPAPYFDNWRLLQDESNFYSRFIVHNEHVINSIAAFSYVDSNFFFGLGLLQLVAIFFFLLSAIFLVFLGLDGFETNSLEKSLLCAPILLSATQFTNITWSFQVGFLGSFVSGCWAIYFLNRSSLSSRPWVWLVACGLCAIYASFSLASGVLLLPILAVMALHQDVGRYAKIGFGTGCILLFVTMIFVTSDGSGGPHNLAAALVFGVTVVGSFFGSIVNYRYLTHFDYDQISVAISILFGLLMAICALIVVGKLIVASLSRRVSKTEIWPMYCTIWLGLSAAAIGWGRSSLPLSEAISSRYVTISCMLLCFIYISSLRAPILVWPSRWVSYLFIAIFGLSMVAQFDRMAQAEIAGRRFENAESALINKTFDTPDINALYPPAMNDSARQLTPIMEEKAISVFSQRRSRLANTNVFSGQFQYEGDCKSESYAITTQEGWYKVSGDLSPETKSKTVVSTDEAGKVLAVGTVRKAMIGISSDGSDAGFVLVASRGRDSSAGAVNIMAINSTNTGVCFVATVRW